MIDFHTHVLPGIDDGAANEETAREMLEESKRQGVDTVLLTSHYYGKRRSPAAFLEKRAACLERLQTVAPEGIRLVPAAEVHFTDATVVSYEDICKLNITGTRYVLLEFSFTSSWKPTFPEKVEDFIQDTGFTPIIAHAERYDEFIKNPKLLYRFVEMGCLVQVNAESFLEKNSRSMAFSKIRAISGSK